MKELTLSEHLLDLYRELIRTRYTFDNLKDTYDLSDSITKKKVDNVRTYFLEYIYPDVNKRRILNAAFENLDQHFRNPGHLLRLVGDVSGIVFKFGFQFPKAIRAGLNTLESFKAASQFEKGLREEAEKRKMKVPISLGEFKALIAALPEKQVREFIDDFDGLFVAFTDTSLLSKTVEILSELIDSMKNHPEVYSQLDVKGMQIGWDILNEGYILFKDMAKKEKREVVDLIIRAENDFLNSLFGPKGSQRTA